MSSRLTGRLLTLRLALGRRLQEKKKREKPRQIERILICHQLLLGDTIMLSPLFAKLRAQHPNAEIVMAAPKSYLQLFSTNPWSVEATSFSL